MNRTASHRITHSTDCRHTGRPCPFARELIERLQAAVAVAGGIVGDELEVSGRAKMDCCALPCVMAYVAGCDESFLFGGVDPADDIETLRAVGRARARGTSAAHILVREPATIVALARRGALS